MNREEAVFEVVRKEYGVTRKLIAQQEFSGPSTQEARMMTHTLLNRGAKLSASRVGPLVNRHRTTIRNSVKSVLGDPVLLCKAIVLQAKVNEALQ